MNVRPIDPFSEKVLRIEACGKEAEQVMIVIPTILKPGQPFDVTVALLNREYMPAFGPTEAFEIEGCSQPIALPASPDGSASVWHVEGAEVNTAGFLRLQTTCGGKTFYSNPALVTEEDRPAIVWGDPHIHTTVGDCHAERCRTRNLAYTIARHVFGLDWVAIADHVSWNPRGTKGKWLDNLANCELYNEPGTFSTIICYETSMRGGHGGDCNVYLRDPQPDYIDPWPDKMHMAQLCDKLEGDFFVVPHHTTRTGKHGEIPAEIYPGPDRMPVVEIHSKWGCSEYRGNPNPLHEIHEGPSYIQDLLAQGYRFGFIGGTDSHSSMTFSQIAESDMHDRLPGLTAVPVQENTREAIFDAMAQKQCYAASGERIFLDVTPGSEEEQVSLKVSCAAQSRIERIDVVCNGEDVHSLQPEDWKAEFEWQETRDPAAIALKSGPDGDPFTYYYVRVTTETESQAWSTPVWGAGRGAGKGACKV